MRFISIDKEKLPSRIMWWFGCVAVFHAALASARLSEEASAPRLGDLDFYVYGFSMSRIFGLLIGAFLVIFSYMLWRKILSLRVMVALLRRGRAIDKTQLFDAVFYGTIAFVGYCCIAGFSIWQGYLVSREYRERTDVRQTLAHPMILNLDDEIDFLSRRRTQLDNQPLAGVLAQQMEVENKKQKEFEKRGWRLNGAMSSQAAQRALAELGKIAARTQEVDSLIVVARNRRVAAVDSIQAVYDARRRNADGWIGGFFDWITLLATPLILLLDAMFRGEVRLNQYRYLAPARENDEGNDELAGLLAGGGYGLGKISRSISRKALNRKPIIIQEFDQLPEALQVNKQFVGCWVRRLVYQGRYKQEEGLIKYIEDTTGWAQSTIACWVMAAKKELSCLRRKRITAEQRRGEVAKLIKAIETRMQKHAEMVTVEWSPDHQNGKVNRAVPREKKAK